MIPNGTVSSEVGGVTYPGRASWLTCTRKGSTWNKALQVEDDFSQFTIETKSGFVSAHHATFVIEDENEKDTEITTLEESVQITIFDKEDKSYKMYLFLGRKAMSSKLFLIQLYSSTVWDLLLCFL